MQTKKKKLSLKLVVVAAFLLPVLLPCSVMAASDKAQCERNATKNYQLEMQAALLNQKTATAEAGKASLNAQRSYDLILKAARIMNSRDLNNCSKEVADIVKCRDNAQFVYNHSLDQAKLQLKTSQEVYQEAISFADSDYVSERNLAASIYQRAQTACKYPSLDKYNPASFGKVKSVVGSLDPSAANICKEGFGALASIKVNAPTIVVYQWERSDGAIAPLEAQTFDAAQTRTAKDSWALSGNYTGWLRLHIITPNDLRSNQIPIKSVCE